MPKVIIKINKDGTVSVKGEGFWGDECKQPIEEITKKLGIVLDEQPLLQDVIPTLKK